MMARLGRSGACHEVIGVTSGHLAKGNESICIACWKPEDFQPLMLNYLRVWPFATFWLHFVPLT